MTIKIEKTSRGFNAGEFVDRYDAKCSIQESSLATERAIWLGCNEGTHTKDEEGNDICMARMHLTQEMVAELIPLLDHFLYTGRLVEDKYEAWANVRVEVYDPLTRTYPVEIRKICLGVFDNKEKAIEGLMTFARHAYGKESKWDGYQVVIDHVPTMLGYNGGFLWKHGVPKR